MKRESFIVYKSFYALIQLLPEKERLKMYESIFNYGFEEKEPTFKDEASKAIWLSILPQLRANNRRYENGLKGKESGKLGGRPKNPDGDIKKTPKKTPNETPNITPYPFSTKTPNENVNENDNVNVYLSNACARVESEDLATFLEKNPKITNNVEEISGVDFQLLDSKIKESEFLQKVESLEWLIERYDKIVTDYYKTFKQKAFDSERNYTKEELDSLIDEL